MENLEPVFKIESNKKGEKAKTQHRKNTHRVYGWPSCVQWYCVIPDATLQRPFL